MDYSQLPRTTNQGKTLTSSTIFDILGVMTMPTSIKLDPKMKRALERLAEKQFAPVTTLIKQAIEKYLKEHGIDWREEE